MIRRLLAAGSGSLVLAALLALGVTATRWDTADALTNCSTSTGGISGTEQQLMTLINNHRAANGAGPLKASPNSFRAAAWMSEDLNASGVFSHTDSLGRSAFARVSQCGYGSNGAGENIASTGSAGSAFNLFLTSPGHNANMLNPAWQVIGVGQTGRMWVVDFGTSDDSSQPWDTGGSPAPPPPTATTQPSNGGVPTATPVAGFPTQNTGSGGVQSAAPSQPTIPGAVRTVLPADTFPQHKLPSNVPVKRAMMQMIAAE